MVTAIVLSCASSAHVIHVPYGDDHPHEPLANHSAEKKRWRCTADEDRGVLAARTMPSAPESVGWYMFYADQFATEEAEVSQSCFRATFGDLVNLTAVTMPLYHRVHHRVHTVRSLENRSKFQSMNCQYAQHGPPAQRHCWARLMLHKLDAARSSPYDITVLMDGDVFANPRLDLPRDSQRAWATNTLQSLVHALGSHDLAFPAKSSARNDSRSWATLAAAHSMLPKDAADFPGGFVVFRKNNATDRFFSCADRAIRAANHTINEQDAYRKITAGGLMRSATVRVLSPSLWCGGESRDVLHTSWADKGGLASLCPFVHSRLVLPEARRKCAAWFRHFPPKSPAEARHAEKLARRKRAQAERNSTINATKSRLTL